MSTDIKTWNVNDEYWSIPEEIDLNQVSNDRSVEIGNLTNPPIIDQRGEFSSDGTWSRSAFGYLRPITLSDKVIVGGTTFVGSEMFRVAGEGRFNSIVSDGLISGISVAINGNTISSALGNYSFNLPEKSGTFALLSDVQSVEWGTILNRPGSTVEDIDLAVTNSHTHDNKQLLDTLDGFTSTELLDSLSRTHDPITVDTTVLTLTNQYLGITRSGALTSGYLDSSDFELFYNKLDSTNTLNAIKDLVLNKGSLIVGDSETTASLITPELSDAGRFLVVNETGDGFELSSSSVVVNWGDIIGAPISTIEDIDLAVDMMHEHFNKDLLDTLGGWTNDQILDVINGSFLNLILDENNSNGLVLSTTDTNKVLGLGLSSFNSTGSLSSSDWNEFNNKLTSTILLNAVKDLELSEASLIYGGGTDTALMLEKGAPNQYLKMTSDSTAIEWAYIDGSGSFVVPTGYTSITNEIGGINNTDYSPVTELNGKSILEVLQEMLFPAPARPVYQMPTASISTSLGNGSFIEKGTTSNVEITSALVSSDGPGGSPYAVSDGDITYEKDDTAFTNGSSVTFTGTSVKFESLVPHTPNTNETITMPNGDVYNASQYSGATSGIANNSKTYTVVDPIYYGEFTAASSDYPAPPTIQEIKDGCNKLISSKPASVSIQIDTYASPVNTHNYICVAYPDSYGQLKSINYLEGSNANVIGNFSETTATYTRADGTTVSYIIKWNLNSYVNNASPVLNYNVYF